MKLSPMLVLCFVFCGATAGAGLAVLVGDGIGIIVVMGLGMVLTGVLQVIWRDE